MKKTYISPTFAVFAITTSSIMEVSNGTVTINSDERFSGSDMDTRKKDNTDMWGNDNSKGIWD